LIFPKNFPLFHNDVTKNNKCYEWRKKIIPALFPFLYLLCKRKKCHNPGQEVRAGSGRKTSEINKTWKQYSVPRSLRIFPATSDHFLVFPRTKRSEVTGKILRLSSTEYCFQVPFISRVFLHDTMIIPASFRPVSMEFACFRSLESSIWEYILYNTLIFDKKYQRLSRKYSTWHGLIMAWCGLIMTWRGIVMTWRGIIMTWRGLLITLNLNGN